MELTTTENVNSPEMSACDHECGLVEASKRGDVAAFEELVRRYDRKLYRIARNVVHNAEDAEEVVQTAFFKAYQNLSRFQGNAKFSTWLIRIALNESLMKLRKQRALREQSIESDLIGEDHGSLALSHRLPVDINDWARSPESLYSRVETRNILTKALEKLRPALKAVFVLRDIEGHSTIETSKILSLSITAVKARLFRARMQLREELSQYFKKPDGTASRPLNRSLDHSLDIVRQNAGQSV